MQKYAAPAAVAIALIMVAYLAFQSPDTGTGSSGAGRSSGGGSGDEVEVTLHVMSQCPYGVKAVDAFTPIARKIGGDRMKLNLEYIGREQDGELSSMHGQSEVDGNKIQLCVAEHSSYEHWLDFLDCQNENWRQIPQGWEQCARQNSVDVDAVRTCFEGDQGTQLLRASFERSTKAGARGSPTIMVAGTKHTGGRTEQALARAVCSQYDANPPRYCAEIPPPPEVPVTILVDRRCDHDDCNTETLERGLKAQIPGAKIARVDFGTDEGRSLFEKASPKMLPAVLVGREIQEDRDAMRVIRDYQRRGDMFVKAVGRFDPQEGEWVPRPEIPVELLGDSRCKSRECGSLPRFEAFLKRQLPNAKISNVDYADEAGQAMWKRVKNGFAAADSPSKRPLGLPLAVFGDTITEEPDTYRRLERRFVKLGDQYMFQLGAWDPESEICDNETDDDGDGAMDCRDSDCSEQMVCRPEKARELTVFVMSQCPFGVQVLNAMEEVLDNFGNDRNKINFRVEFVGNVSPSGELTSMHGQAEVDENLREICAQHHYGDEYQFMDYVLCRNKNIRSNEWESCATGPIKADVIRQCSEGPEGQRLLQASFELGKALGFTGSPSWLLNNRFQMNGRDAESIKTAFCEHNELPECANTLTKAAPRRGGGGGGGGGSCG